MTRTARWEYFTHSELATGARSTAEQEQDKCVRNVKLIDVIEQSNQAFKNEIAFIQRSKYPVLRSVGLWCMCETMPQPEFCCILLDTRADQDPAS